MRYQPRPSHNRYIYHFFKETRKVAFFKSGALAADWLEKALFMKRRLLHARKKDMARSPSMRLAFQSFLLCMVILFICLANRIECGNDKFYLYKNGGRYVAWYGQADNSSPKVPCVSSLKDVDADTVLYAFFNDGKVENLYCPITFSEKGVPKLERYVNLRLNRNPLGDSKPRSLRLTSASEDDWNLVDRKLEEERIVGIALHQRINGKYVFQRGFRLEYEEPFAYYQREVWRILKRMGKVVLYKNKRNAFLGHCYAYLKMLWHPFVPLAMSFGYFLLWPSLMRGLFVVYLASFESSYGILPSLKDLFFQFVGFMGNGPVLAE